MTPTGRLSKLTATVYATGDVTQGGGVASLGMMDPFAQPKPYEIMPSAKGCGCGGGCGPCGDSGGTRAWANQLDPNILRARIGVQFPTSLMPGAAAQPSFDPPLLQGGPVRSVCESIHDEIEQLILWWYRLQNRCNAIVTAYVRCRGGRPIDCYSFEVESNEIAEEERALGDAWNDAGEGPEAQRVRGDIDRRREQIAMYRMNVMSPAWQSCGEQVNMNANARKAECIRLRRHLQDCAIERRRLGDYILRAFDNYIGYAQRLGCAIDPGLRIEMGGISDTIRYSPNEYQDFDFQRDGSLLFHSFDDYVLFEVPF